MKKPAKKQFLLFFVVISVVAAIVFIESQKPDIKGNIPEINAEKNSKYPKAPEFVGIERWINSEPLKLEQLKGKVVLVDFWTYTCINCIRTLPYLKEWDKRYREQGLVIVGVHTPEFEFEKKYENVLKAVKDYKLEYAVAQDNNYATWSVYQNRYWPHKFLIDMNGYIRYDHIGEGGYEETEKVIQELLKERAEKSNQELRLNETKIEIAEDYKDIRTPEIYFGYQFSRGNFGNEEGIKQEEIINYKIPASIEANNVYLSGQWKNNADNMELAGDEGSILLVFHAKDVNIVAGSEPDSKATVFLDGKNSNELAVNEFKLYNIASAEDYRVHTIKIDVKGKGFRIYTFTFG